MRHIHAACCAMLHRFVPLTAGFGEAGLFRILFPFWFAALLLALASPVVAASVTVRLVDHISGAVLIGEKIEALERSADGRQIFLASRLTNAQGEVRFTLNGLGAGKTFFFRAWPYQQSMQSADVAVAGSLTLRAGLLQVQVIDGRTGMPAAGQLVELKAGPDDAGLIPVLSAQTDAQGWLRVDPPDLGRTRYVVEALSPTDALPKRSGALWSKGPHRFVLGNPTLDAKLIDAISLAPLNGIPVEALERMADGRLLSRLHRVTNAQGLARFDLDGINDGRHYLVRAKPYLQTVQSPEISQAGEYVLPAGRLQVDVVDGRIDRPYANRDVELIELQSDGSQRGLGVFQTDARGRVRLDPPALGDKPYQLKAASLMDGSIKRSPQFTQAGAYSFTVGGVGAKLKLLDYSGNLPLAGIRVEALRKMPDNSLVSLTTRDTDALGLALFDLDGLGKGDVFQFRAKPFQHAVLSAEVRNVGTHNFVVGTLPVSLSDAESGAALAGVKVNAYDKSPSGVLTFIKQGVTDAAGMLKLDLDRLGGGAVYVLAAINPFGDAVSHYSRLITSKGAVAFALRRGSPNTPDRTSPELDLLFPAPDGEIGMGGARFYGHAADNRALRDVRVVITLPGGQVVDKPAVYNTARQLWQLDSGALPASGPGDVQVRVIATDTSFNVSEVSANYRLVADSTLPVLNVMSHADGDSVPQGRFLVSGRLLDNLPGASLSARIEGGDGVAAVERTVEVAPTSGAWALLVESPSVLDGDGNLRLQLTARDSSGNSVVVPLRLHPSDSFDQAWHVLQRTTYGAQGGQLKDVVQTGVANFLSRQLQPDQIDDGDFAARLAVWPDGGQYIGTGLLRYGLYSRRQLLEKMVWFWENHFNTNYMKHLSVAYEGQETQAFRANAFGNFRTLLGISAKSPAMLKYLDGDSNYRARPNENYARELLELHTLGVKGGYTQHDVEETARIFTGWRVQNGAFFYQSGLHDAAAKTVLGRAFPAGGGQEEGENLLDLVAARPATASNLCRKLIATFVHDRGVGSLLPRCQTAFTGNVQAPDQIARVLGVILESDEFLGATYRGLNYKTPVEFMAGLMRNLGIDSDGDDLALELSNAGMGVYTNPIPTGYAEQGKAWISTGVLLSEIGFVDRLLPATGNGASRLDLAAAMRNRGLETAEGVVGYLLESMLGPTLTRRHFDTLLRLFTDAGRNPYLAWQPDAEARLRGLVKMIAALPEYQYQ